MFKVSLKSNPRVGLLLRLVIRLLGETRQILHLHITLYFDLISCSKTDFHHRTLILVLFVFFVSDDTLWTKDALFYILLLKI